MCCLCKYICKRNTNRRPRLLHLQCYMVSRGRQRTHTLIAKGRTRTFRCCDLALFHKLVIHIRLNLLHLFQLDRFVQAKLAMLCLSLTTPTKVKVADAFMNRKKSVKFANTYICNFIFLSTSSYIRNSRILSNNLRRNL